MLCLIFVVLVIGHLCSASIKDCKEVSKNKTQLCYKNGFYDTNFPSPPLPMLINTTVTLIDMVDFNTKDNTITIFMQLLAQWTDPGLFLTLDKADHLFFINQETSESIFFPRLKIQRAEDIQTQINYGPNERKHFWYKHPSQLEYKETLKVTLYCSFDFSSFPFDQHECSLNFGAFDVAYSKLVLNPPIVNQEDKSVKLGDAPMTLTNERGYLPFDIQMTSKDRFQINDQSGVKYSYVGVKFYFRRNKLGLLMGSYYGPMIIFSLLTLISFFINPEVVPGRMGLLVTLYLIAANVYNSVNAPESRGFSYIELYAMCVQIIILFAITEYGVVLAMLKYSINSRSSESREEEERKFWLQKRLKSVDQWSFLITSIFILLFNMSYWPAIV